MTYQATGAATSNTQIALIKLNDEIVNNSSTLQNDDDFSFALGAGEGWFVDLQLQIFGTSQAADFKVAALVPAGCAMSLPITAPQVAETGGIGGAAVRDMGSLKASGVAVGIGNLGDSTDGTTISIRGTVINGATPGVFQLQWAQNTPTVADTTVRRLGSFLARRRIE